MTEKSVMGFFINSEVCYAANNQAKTIPTVPAVKEASVKVYGASGIAGSLVGGTI